MSHTRIAGSHISSSSCRRASFLISLTLATSSAPLRRIGGCGGCGVLELSASSSPAVMADGVATPMPSSPCARSHTCR
eukprot:6952688-Prymnesium_polylepis.1